MSYTRDIFFISVLKQMFFKTIANYLFFLKRESIFTIRSIQSHKKMLISKLQLRFKLTYL